MHPQGCSASTFGKSSVSDLNTSKGVGVVRQSKSVQRGIGTCSSIVVKGEDSVWSWRIRAIDTQRALASSSINCNGKADENGEVKGLHRWGSRCQNVWTGGQKVTKWHGWPVSGLRARAAGTVTRTEGANSTQPLIVPDLVPQVTKPRQSQASKQGCEYECVYVHVQRLDLQCTYTQNRFIPSSVF